MNVQKIINKKSKYAYLSLDTSVANDLIDNIKFVWYIKNLLNVPGLYNIKSIRLGSFVMNYSIANNDVSRLTILVDEFKNQSFVHNERRFHFYGENITEAHVKYRNITDNPLLLGYTKNGRFDFPYGNGEFIFDKPYRFIDSITLSIADPFIPLNFTLGKTINNVSVSVSGDGFLFSSSELSDALAKNTYVRFIVSGLTSTSPNEDGLLRYTNRPEGFPINNNTIYVPYAASGSILFPPMTIVGVLSNATITLREPGILFNLVVEYEDNKSTDIISSDVSNSSVLGGLSDIAGEILSLMSDDGSNNDNAESLFSRIIKYPTILRITDNIFGNIWKIKTSYVSLDTSLATSDNYNIVSWGLKEYFARTIGMASNSIPLKNIIGIKCLSIVKNTGFSYIDIGENDMTTIYIKELGSNCYTNKANNISYNFILEKKYVMPFSHIGVPRIEYSAYGNNGGCFMLDRPITELSSITLESKTRTKFKGFVPRSLSGYELAVNNIGFNSFFNSISFIVNIPDIVIPNNSRVYFNDALINWYSPLVPQKLNDYLNSTSGILIKAKYGQTGTDNITFQIEKPSYFNPVLNVPTYDIGNIATVKISSIQTVISFEFIMIE